MIPENTPHGSRVNKHKGMMTYALDQNGKLVHIDSVPNGLNCNCHCPACNEPLSARQGKKNEHSFAHPSGSQCAYGYQTSLHLLAKEIISEGCKILLPPVFYDRKALDLSKLDNEDLESIESPIRGPFTLEKADSIQLEVRYGDIIPDIILYYNGKPLIVEIYVTHPVDEEKEDKIRKAGVSAIEFDLSAVDREIDKECLRSILEKGENCRWIYNSWGAEKTRVFMKSAEERFDKRKLEEQRKGEKERERNIQRQKEVEERQLWFQSNQEESEKEKQELIKQNGGYFQYYKIQRTSLSDGYVPIIYDPPCNENVVVIDGIRLKKGISCYSCPYYLGIDDFGMLCQRRRHNNSKPNLTSEVDMKRWILVFYRTHTNKVSIDKSRNEELLKNLIMHAEEVARLSGHEEYCGSLIISFCNALVSKEYENLLLHARMKPQRSRFRF